MPLKLSDRVRENTTTVGSGILSLVGNTDGFRRFDNVLASGDITYYCIEENNKFEVGIGTYQNNSISRDYILQSTQSGSKINLGGSGVVFLTYPADKAVYKNQESEVVVGPSGIRFFDNTVQKTATISSSSQDISYISGIAIYSSGEINNNYVNINSHYTVSKSNNKIFVDCSSSNINVYIPTASGLGGKGFTIKKITGNNNLYIRATGMETVDGQNPYTVFHAYESINITSNNNNWFIT
jgi:hypothetical protein